MITDAEARSFYAEFLKLLHGAGADVLVENITEAVAEGRVHERDRRAPTLEALSPQKALALAVRMFAAWLEPVFLVEEAQKEFRGPSGAELGLRWTNDRLDVVASEHGGRDEEPAGKIRQEVSPIPVLTGQAAGDLRALLDRLHQIVLEIEADEEVA